MAYLQWRAERDAADDGDAATEDAVAGPGSIDAPVAAVGHLGRLVRVSWLTRLTTRTRRTDLPGG